MNNYLGTFIMYKGYHDEVKEILRLVKATDENEATEKLKAYANNFISNMNKDILKDRLKWNIGTVNIAETIE